MTLVTTTVKRSAAGNLEDPGIDREKPRMASNHWDARASGRSSIVDVARLAGVSKQTVSNVLNGKTGYTPETKARVVEAMDQLSYQPRQAARTLKSRKTMQLGYHLLGSQLETQTGFGMPLLQSLVRCATERGYNLLVFSDPVEGEFESFERLISAGAVDGFLLSDLSTDDPRPRALAERGVPFATMGRLPADLPPRWIDIDNGAAVKNLVDYLVEAGHRDLAFIGPADNEYWTAEREEGFRATMAGHGLRVKEDFVFSGTRPDVREFARKLLGRKRRPTAVVASNDAVGADVINAAHSVGLVVGKEISVTGVGGGLLTQVTYPTLTTMQIPVEDVARGLIDMCLRAAQGSAQDAPVILPTHLWRGGSA